jgi:threonine aldolase
MTCTSASPGTPWSLPLQLKSGLSAKGYTFHPETVTNQQFPVVKNTVLEPLSKKVVYSLWEPLDKDRSVIRLATSWATTEEDVAALLACL